MVDEVNPNQAEFTIGETSYTMAIEADGAYKIGEDRYIKESDLTANKEANTTRLAEQVELHKQEISQLSGDGASSRQLLLQTQSERDTFKTQAEANSTAAKALEEAKASIAGITTSRDTNVELALGYRKQAIVMKHSLNPDILNGKNMDQLNYFEEALSAVGVGVNQGGAAGAGNYAAGLGGAGTTAMTSMERALKALEAADVSHSSRPT